MGRGQRRIQLSTGMKYTSQHYEGYHGQRHIQLSAGMKGTSQHCKGINGKRYISAPDLRLWKGKVKFLGRIEAVYMQTCVQ